ncbi:MAG: elongation factor P, partial [Ruminococcus sp.]
NIFGVEPPTTVALTVTQTDPGFKGDTATNATKPAILETGAEIKVPLFIDEGEVIQIDTRTGEYMGRA